MSAVTAHTAPSAALRFARGINVGLAVFLVLYGTIAVLQPGYFEVEGFLNFLRRAAPLIILACGQLFVEMEKKRSRSARTEAPEGLPSRDA